MIRALPSRHACDSMIQQYLDTVEGTHRLLHIPTFRRELDTFWASPMQVGYEWLAQMLLIVYIGHDVLPPSARRTVITTEHDERFFQATIAPLTDEVLHRSKVFLRASLTIVRALCLTILARQLRVYSCMSIDTSGALADLALRAATSLCINSGPTTTTTAAQNQISARLWISVVYLKLHQAMSSGAPVLLPQDVVDSVEIANWDDDDFGVPDDRRRKRSGYTDSWCHMLMAKTIPTAVQVIASLNSRTPELTSDWVSACEAKLRRHLLDAEQMFAEAAEDETLTKRQRSWIRLQRPMIGIWLRRLLLSLHLPHVPCKSPSVPRSVLLRWAETGFGDALAILVLQRHLLEILDDDFAKRKFAGLFKHDFFYAALVSVVHIQQIKSGLSDEINSQNAKEKAVDGLASQCTVRQTLLWCNELWIRDAHASDCDFWAYLVMDSLMQSI